MICHDVVCIVWPENSRGLFILNSQAQGKRSRRGFLFVCLKIPFANKIVVSPAAVWRLLLWLLSWTYGDSSGLSPLLTVVFCLYRLS